MILKEIIDVLIFGDQKKKSIQISNVFVYSNIESEMLVHYHLVTNLSLNSDLMALQNATNDCTLLNIGFTASHQHFKSKILM